MCACNSHSLENRRLLWPTLDLKSSTVIVLLSHFHFHWGAASKQPRTRAPAVHWRGAAADQRHHCRGRAQLCGIWADCPRPADLAVSAERPMLFFEAVGGRRLVPLHCIGTSCILADCMSLPLSQSKKKWEHFHVTWFLVVFGDKVTKILCNDLFPFLLS